MNNYGFDNGAYQPYQQPVMPDNHNSKKKKSKKKGKHGYIWMSMLMTVILLILLLLSFTVGVFVGYSTDLSLLSDLFATDNLLEDSHVDVNHIGLKNKFRYLGENPGIDFEQPPLIGNQTMTSEQVFAKTAPSIVEITTYFEDEDYGALSYSYGSGIIMSEDGYIITNAHVLCDSMAEFHVRLFDGTEYEAEIVGADPQCDVGILKINAESLTAASFAKGSELKVGQTVYTLGNPGGEYYSHTFCQGIVSGLNRNVQIEDTVSDITYIQTDASINPGNSGGALINEYGQVVGINVASMNGYDNMGFTIPIDQVTDIIDDLFEYGYVPDRMRIGVRLFTVDEYFAKYYESEQGLEVLSISPDSNYEKAGGKTGDIITHVDKIKVNDLSELQKIISQKKPGDSIQLTVNRAKKLTGEYSEYLVIDLQLIADDTVF